MGAEVVLAAWLLSRNAAQAAGSAVLAIACVLLFPIALSLLVASSNGRRGTGPSWTDLVGGLRPWRPPSAGRLPDRMFALLVTRSGELILIRHSHRQQGPYYTLPGGPIRLATDQPEHELSRRLAAAGLEPADGWRLVHIDRAARHRDLVFTASVAHHDLDADNVWGRRARIVTVAAASACALDLRPHSVARAVRHVAAAGGDPLTMPDLRGLAWPDDSAPAGQDAPCRSDGRRRARWQRRGRDRRA